MTEHPPIRFRRPYLIRFSYCDPGGIVYFPRYLRLFNHLVEDWFTFRLGISYAQLVGARRIGLPIVRLECDFRAISRIGEQVDFGLELVRVGNTSLTLNMDAAGDGEVRVETRQVLVFTSLDTHRAIPIPTDVRSALRAAV